MAPQQILPIHDGYAKPFFLKQRYELYSTYFTELGMTFHALRQPGDSIEIDDAPATH